ncbi:MAG TPA: hypothetical protein VK081_12980 [Planctomycetota bacterium]|nr:hypothetical protein [Planctomycetota bacterium]
MHPAKSGTTRIAWGFANQEPATFVVISVAARDFGESRRTSCRSYVRRERERVLARVRRDPAPPWQPNKDTVMAAKKKVKKKAKKAGKKKARKA